MLGGIPILQGGAAALVSLICYFVLTGRLVPASHLKAVREDRDKAVARADAETQRWRQALEYSEQARRLDAQHVEQLLEFGHATNSVLTALPGQREGDPDASSVEA